MICYEDRCVSCENGCVGSACSNLNVSVYYCDICDCETDELFEVDGDDLCLDCLKERFKKEC